MVKTEIAINGGGIAGLLCGIVLAQQNIDVSLIEKRKLETPKTPKNSGRTAALKPPALALLQQAGVWDGIKNHCAPLETIRIIDGDARLDFIAAEIKHPYFAMNIPNDLLHAALIQKAQTLPSLHIYDGNGLWNFKEQDNHILIHMNNDRDIQAKLLIAADGRHSTVRDIAGIKTIKNDYGQSVITCLINHSKSHNNTSTEFHKPGGPFTLVPCPGNQSSVVWCETHDEIETLMALKKTDFCQALQDRTQNCLGEISLETSPQSLRLKGIMAQKLTAHRLVLIAEAAHALHPIGAQGLNLSLQDIQTLYDLICRQKSLGLDLGTLEMLKTYKSRRRSDTFMRFVGVGSVCALTSKQSKNLQIFRQAGLKLIEHSSFLRRSAMKLGLGAKAA